MENSAILFSKLNFDLKVLVNWNFLKDLENLEKIRKDSINDSENRIILWLKRFFSYFNSNQSRLWRIERTLWNSQQQRISTQCSLFQMASNTSLEAEILLFSE